MTCKLCGGYEWILEGSLYDGNGTLQQQTFSCKNEKCAGQITLDPDGKEI